MSNKISGTVKAETKFLHQVFLPFNNITASNLTKDFEKVYSSTDITKLYFASLDITNTPTVLDLEDLTNPLTNEEQDFSIVKYLHVVNDGADKVLIGGGDDDLFELLPPLESDGCFQLTNSMELEVGGNTITIQTETGETATIHIVIAGS